MLFDDESAVIILSVAHFRLVHYLVSLPFMKDIVPAVICCQPFLLCASFRHLVAEHAVTFPRLIYAAVLALRGRYMCVVMYALLWYWGAEVRNEYY